MDFFAINSNAMTKFLEQLCQDWATAEATVRTYACISQNCEAQEIFHQQWSNSTLSVRSASQESMNHLKHVNGHPEVNLFIRDVFMPNRSESIREQFKDVNFKNNRQPLDYARLFDPDDLEYSLYNFTIVKTMFEIGEMVDGNSTSTSIEVKLFDSLIAPMYITNKEAYIIYKWLQHLASRTYLQGGTADLASFATITAPLLNQEIENFVTDFGSHYIARVFNKFFKNETCADVTNRIFPGKNTSRL